MPNELALVGRRCFLGPSTGDELKSGWVLQADDGDVLVIFALRGWLASDERVFSSTDLTGSPA